MNPLHSRMDREARLGRSGSEPPPIPVSTRPLCPQTDDGTTASINEGLNINPADGNPTQQRSFPVSPLSAAGQWNSLSHPALLALVVQDATSTVLSLLVNVLVYLLIGTFNMIHVRHF